MWYLSDFSFFLYISYSYFNYHFVLLLFLIRTNKQTSSVMDQSSMMGTTKFLKDRVYDETLIQKRVLEIIYLFFFGKKWKLMMKHRRLDKKIFGLVFLGTFPKILIFWENIRMFNFPILKTHLCWKMKTTNILIFENNF